MDSNRHSRARLLDGATAAAVMSMTTVVIGASDVTDHRDNDRHSSGSVITHTHTWTAPSSRQIVSFRMGLHMGKESDAR